MKHVFTSDYDIAHLWANQAQNNARKSGNNNFYFNPDKTIYSYGRHFPIAKLVGKYVLFTTRGYSVTTSKHISTVKGALSQDQSHNIIYVNNPNEIDIRYRSNFYRSLLDDVEFLAEQIPNVKARIANARKPEKYIPELTGLEDHVNRIEAFAKDYAKNVPVLPDDLMKDGTSYVSFNKKRLSMAIRKFRKSAVLENMADLKTAIAKRDEQARIKSAKIDADMLAKFRAGEVDYVYNNSNTTYLRVDNDTVRTSRGIRIERPDAIRLYAAFKAKKLIGQKFDYHTITSVEKDTVIAGCHHIPFSEIELAAVALGIAA